MSIGEAHELTNPGHALTPALVRVDAFGRTAREVRQVPETDIPKTG
jgi:hypothetical protein